MLHANVAKRLQQHTTILCLLSPFCPLASRAAEEQPKLLRRRPSGKATAEALIEIEEAQFSSSRCTLPSGCVVPAVAVAVVVCVRVPLECVSVCESTASQDTPLFCAVKTIASVCNGNGHNQCLDHNSSPSLQKSNSNTIPFRVDRGSLVAQTKTKPKTTKKRDAN